MPRPTKTEKETLQDAILLLAMIEKKGFIPESSDLHYRIKTVGRRLIRVYERWFGDG